MGRFKTLEIQGLLIESFEKSFIDGINSAIKNLGLTEDEALKKLEHNSKKLISAYEETISSLYVQHHKLNLDDFLHTHFKNQQVIANAYRDSFTGFILYINGCFSIYDKIISRVKRKRVDSTLKITVALYGLIIRRADEILNQLLCGYIDGAMILWRSLYENAIILLVLAIENNNELADRYFHHSLKNSRRKILSYQENYKKLKFKALPKSTEKKLLAEIDKIDARYGKSFLGNEYGWADCLFDGKQKANFRLLEERVEMNRFRPYYLLCCEHIHSNFNGFNDYKLGNKIILPWLVIPETKFEAFVDPMQFTVSILNEVNDYILYEFSVEEEYNVNALLMRKVFEKQQMTFKKPKGKNSNRFQK